MKRIVLGEGNLFAPKFRGVPKMGMYWVRLGDDEGNPILMDNTKKFQGDSKIKVRLVAEIINDEDAL